MSTMLTTSQMQRIMLDVDLGVPVAESEVPRSPEADAFRAQVTAEVAAIKARGHGVRHYDEFPDLSATDLAEPSALASR
jgi:hypothetical protein